jgi:hypothetical protein
MQLTRGLFRLWVVASVLWIASVGVMTWQAWPVDDWTIVKEEPVFAPNAKVTPLPEFDQKSSGRGRKSSRPAEPPFDPDAYLKETTPRAETTSVPNWAIESEKPSAKPQFDPSKPFSDGKRTYANSKAFVQAERRDAVMKGAAIGVTPPVAVLLLGISLIWVVRGFRP